MVMVISPLPSHGCVLPPQGDLTINLKAHAVSRGGVYSKLTAKHLLLPVLNRSTTTFPSPIKTKFKIHKSLREKMFQKQSWELL